VTKAKAGDADAFDCLVSMHQKRVFAFAYRMLANREDAADIVQETFVRAWRSLGKFRMDAGFSTWICKIAVNLCISFRRRSKPKVVPFDDELIDHSETAACDDRVATAVVVRSAIASLGAHYRALIILREIEGRSFEDISEILGCSVGSARSRCCRARQMLRDKLRVCLKEEDR
jgi:RNA polymerase sigma-70 factor (ECF subfamily)